MIMAGIDTFTDATISYNAFIEYCAEAFQLLKVVIEEKGKNHALIAEHIQNSSYFNNTQCIY